MSYIGDFEQAVAREARKRGLQGVVCGHIHHAELRDIDGILYANDGDWVESLTALAEHADGTLETFEGAETVDGSRDRACDTVERWMRDTYGDLAAFSAWLAD